MSILKDIINKRKSNTEEEEKKDEIIVIGKYTLSWASRVAITNGYQINDDKDKVNGIIEALNRRNGQCPCGGSGQQFKCPCVVMRTKEICKCGLFKTFADRKVASSGSTARIKIDEE